MTVASPSLARVLVLALVLGAVPAAALPGPVVAAGAGRAAAGSVAVGSVAAVPDGGRGRGYVAPVPGVDPPAGVVRGFEAPEHEYAAGHRGVDLASAPGQVVVSPGPGVVTFAGQVAGRGVVVVTHPDGLRSSLEPVAAGVPSGTAVAAGTPVAVVEGGSGPGGDGTGDAAGGGAAASHCAPDVCVHWGVRRGERYLDPLTLLDRPVIVLLPAG